jgi:hypothetical protein
MSDKDTALASDHDKVSKRVRLLTVFGLLLCVGGYLNNRSNRVTESRVMDLQRRVYALEWTLYHVTTNGTITVTQDATGAYTIWKWPTDTNWSKEGK